MTRSSDLRSRIAHADICIAELKRQLAQLRAHRTQLKTELEAIIYPILTIPPEITAEILCHAAAGEHTDWLLVVSSVCARWRSIALSTPRLWTNFSETAQHWRPGGKAFRLLQLCLSRSGSLPLNLTLHLGGDGERMLALMTRHISRWHCVDLRHTAFWNNLLDEGHPHPQPSLTLHGDVPLTNMDFDSCPKWRSVVLSHTTVTPNSLLPTLSNVTSLILYDVPSSIVARVLPHTPSVKFLFLAGCEGSIGSISPISLPCVDTLHYSLPSLLPHVTLPALQTIRVRDSNLPSSEELHSFLTRSACTIRTVNMDYCDDPVLVEFLRAIPSVVEFTGRVDDLYHSEVYEDVVLAFFDAFGAGDILPAVEKMSLLRIPSGLLPRLQSALDGKIQLPTSRLKKLTVEGSLRYAITEELELALAEKGVEVEIIHYDG
ncbi:hypothetical protein C8F01DRAFT_1237044 [Mycena amicta]|nr:hypothetical protein C8F01DRAFT_1237044 [Mycena amicta]